jgi:hypoxia up-regulated 1
MDRVVPAGESETVLFYNLGATSLQISVVKYYSYQAREMGKNKTVGAFEVKSKAWDSTLGGEAWDNVIVEYLADQFNEKWGKGDVRTVPRAMVKVRIEEERRTARSKRRQMQHTV